MAIDRRTWLKHAGAAALGLSVLDKLGCDEELPAARADADATTSPDAGDASSATGATAPDGADTRPDGSARTPATSTRSARRRA
ncbi:MAG: hypothetical protein U1F43_25230 [Myxococcota bacterium]